MPSSKNAKCKCCSKRYVSCGVDRKGQCLDVCTDPICGDPDCLTVLTPVVYDELGINLCRNVPLESSCSKIDRISVQVMDISFGCDCCKSSAVPIIGRPNCYLVTLTNLKVTFFITFYDCAGKILDTKTVCAVYLPCDPSSCDYAYMDEDTNPECVELEIYAPYGVAHEEGSDGCTIIHVVGFGPDNTALHQGLNLIAIPKVLCFCPEEDTATIGLSILLKTVYFSQYRIPHKGRAVVPKACTRPTDDTICLDFVCGDLLDLSIKPLELGPPKYEEMLKNDCDVPCDPCCKQDEKEHPHKEKAKEKEAEE